MAFLSVNNRTTLHLLEPAMAPALYAAVDANRAHLRQWLPWLDHTNSVAAQSEFIAASVHKRSNSSAFDCAIMEETELIGVISFHWVNTANRSAAMGYWLSQSHQGKGIMTAACRVMIDHAFSVLMLNRIEISVATKNFRSRHIPERLDFTLEGIRRDAEWLYDHFVDHAVYSMLQRDLPTLRSAV